MSKQDAKDERRTETQKRTFTRWINAYLRRHDSLSEVCDLFQDIQDGRILMVLLEELTGCKLLYRFRTSSHRIFRLNNISKALAFLDDRHVKLLGIDASAVADGVPTVVLNLIWNIILHFQVKEMTGGLHRRLSSSLSSLSMGSEVADDAAPNSGRNTVKGPKYHGKAIKRLLHWVQRCTLKFGVEVHDFGRSWRNGLAFLALIKSISPVLVDLRESLTKDPQENLEQAFKTAHQHLDIPPLLETQDVTCSCPDEKSIITYVSMFLRHCPKMVEDLSTAVNSSHISKFRSLETLADQEDAQPVFSNLETSHELLLWKRWARRSSNSASPNKRKSSSALQPPSPLDADVANPDIRSWLVRSSDHGYSKMKNNEIHFSLSSEEGIYSVTPLDSDEEDAYSYILDLNKDVLQSQATRQVPRVEEETDEIGQTNDEQQDQMFEFTTNGEVQVHSKHFNGISKDKSGNTGEERVKKMQKAANKELTKQTEEKTSMGKNVLPEKLSSQKVMDLEGNNLDLFGNIKKETTERKTQLETSYMKKPTDNLLYNNEAENKIQTPHAQKVHEDKKSRETGESTTSWDSFTENLNEDMNTEKDHEFKKLRHDESLHSYKTNREVSEAKYKCGSNSRGASERGILVGPVAPSSGLNWTELKVLLFLWILVYCYFIGRQNISY